MDRSFVRWHELERTNEIELVLVVIDGSALTTSSSSAGLLVGKDFCDAKDNGSNTVTLTFKEPLERAPYIVGSQGLSGTAVILPSSVTSSVTSIVFDTVTGADFSTGAADSDIAILLACPRGIDLV